MSSTVSRPLAKVTKLEEVNSKKVEVVMGISGCGKTTIGQGVAHLAAIPFLDGDDFHPRENVLKMSRGLALDDDDRWPWLAAIVEYVKQSHREHFVLACSALKQEYRSFLTQSLDCQFHYLHISRQVAIDRMTNRKGHFMKPGLVDSQLDTLEVTPDLHQIDGAMSQEQITEAIIQKMK